MEDLSKFDDVRLHENVIFALESSEDATILNQVYQTLADDNRERFYFFSKTTTTTNNNLIESVVLHAIGNNFTKSIEITLKNKSEDQLYRLMENFMQVSQAQDILIWDFERHINNDTYMHSLDGKLVIVAMAGLQTEYLTTDFLADFRKFQQAHRYSLNKYAFVLIDLDNEPMFNFLTTFNLGRFDSPGIFALNGSEILHARVYYRNYYTYCQQGSQITF